MLESSNSKDIVYQLKAGNVKCFEEVFKYYFKPLSAFATQYVSGENAQEVVQDTMIWLWENRDSIIEELSLKSLLFTIVRNKCLNKVKALQVRSRVHSKIVDKHKEQFENPNFYLEKELYTLYAEALKKLPENYKVCFEMSRKEKLTHKEIAEVLDVSPQTVNYRIGKALEVLREELKDYLPLLLVLFTTTKI